jgi:hypothetical protein
VAEFIHRARLVLDEARNCISELVVHFTILTS